MYNVFVFQSSRGGDEIFKTRAVATVVYPDNLFDILIDRQRAEMFTHSHNHLTQSCIMFAFSTKTMRWLLLPEQRFHSNPIANTPTMALTLVVAWFVMMCIQIYSVVVPYQK